MKEADLYDPVRKHIDSEMGCWTSRVKVGVPHTGEIDVLGVRFTGGELSGTSELIAIEVKPSDARFAVSAGQAHGYSVAADRCYLAVATDDFSPTQVMVASRLGVGLIRLTMSGKNVRVTEILTAPNGDPVEELRLQAAERLGLASCSLCKTLFPRYEEKPTDFKGVVRATQRGRLQTAAGEKKGLIWWLDAQSEQHGRTSDSGVVKVRRYLCPDCSWAVAPGPV